MSHVEINPGEILVSLTSAPVGKVTFEELGISNDQLKLDSGNLRLVFDLDGVGEHKYFHTPTIEVSYHENVAETHWICDFNETMLLDKLDHYGHSTVLLLNRSKIESSEHHHENKLIVHADIPQAVSLDAAKSYINLFK